MACSPGIPILLGMDGTHFQAGFPGRLIPTIGYNRRVRNGIEEPVPVAGEAFLPDPLPPKGVDRDAFIGRLYPGISAAEQALVRVDATTFSLPNAELLLAPFRRREAKLSSQIENTIASVEEVALVEVDRPPARGDAVEVYNYLRALDHGAESPLPLCVRLFHEMHALLMEGVRGDEKQPGRFRSRQNHIGGADERFEAARFVPPPAGEHLDACMRDLEAFLNPDGVRPPREVRYPQVIEAAMAHYQFEAIHPYADGNGRLGRLIAGLMLSKSGPLSRPIVYISAYFEKHRREYYDLLLRVSTHGDWESWCRFFCDAVATQAEDGLCRARRLLDLRDEFVRRVTQPRWSSLLPQLVQRLFERPAVRVGQVAEMFSLSPQGAQNLIDRLASVGVLEEVTGGEYGRVYVAREIVRAIEEDEVRPG